MNVAVLRFPGSNCDQDAYYSLRDDVGVGADYVWYENTSLAGFEQGTGVTGLYSVGRNGEFAHILMEDVFWRTRRKLVGLVDGTAPPNVEKAW